MAEKGAEFEEINIEEANMSRDDLYDKTGGRSVPQIVIEGESIGGYDDMMTLEAAGELALE